MSERPRRFHPLVVGASAGLAIGDLLVGLNPDALGLLASARLLAGGAALGALVSSPLALVPPRRPAARIGFLVLAAAAALLALFVESEREIYYLFLRNGTRRVLVVTTLVLAGAAAAALLAVALRPRPRTASRALAAVCVALVVPPLFGRRAVDQVGLASPVPFPRTATRSLLVVGFEGLSWDVLSALASEGTLPVFARLLRGGAAGPLETLEPYDRAALWTTAATGKRPAKHAVVSHLLFATPLGAFRLLPRIPGAAALRPSFLSPREDVSPRRSLAFWEVLARSKHEAAVLDWPYADPPKGGLVLWAAERLFDGDDSSDAALPEVAGARARLFRVSLGNLDQPLVRALAPSELPSEERVLAPEGAARDLSVVGAALAAVPQGAESVSTLVLSGAARSAPTIVSSTTRSRTSSRARGRTARSVSSRRSAGARRRRSKRSAASSRGRSRPPLPRRRPTASSSSTDRGSAPACV